MSRRKLLDLGLELPMLPTTSVGSLPKPESLCQAEAARAGGHASDDDLYAARQSARHRWIRMQQEIGLDVLVDGEQDRDDLVTAVALGLDGVHLGGLVRAYGNTYHRKPVIDGLLGWKEPITIGYWRAAQDLTEKPVKAVLPGPYTLVDWCYDQHYADRRSAVLAAAHALRQEAEALVEAGVRILQIDEPALPARPREIPAAAEAVGRITRDLPAYTICHLCGGRFAEIYPAILEIPVDQLSLETSGPSSATLDHFHRHPFRLDLGLGVLDVREPRVETADEVTAKLRDALSLLPMDRIWVQPDCGLKARTVDEAVAKLRAMVEGVAETRRLVAPQAY